MNEAQLEAFIAICQYGSFNKAAASLYLTQPTITHRLHQLEKELGVTLILRKRATSGVALTEAGRTFLPQAETLLALHRRIRRELSHFQDKQKVTIGFSQSMLDGEYGPYFLIMQHIAPQLPIQLQTRALSRAAGQHAQLQSGEVDVLFTDVTAASWQESGIGRKKLFEGRLYACLHRNHPLAARDELSLQNLAGETLCWLEDDTFVRELAEKQLADHSVQAQPQVFGTLAEALLALRPSGGILMTHLRRKVAEHLVYVPMKPGLDHQVGLVWLKRTCSPALRQLIDAIAALPTSVWKR